MGMGQQLSSLPITTPLQDNSEWFSLPSETFRFQAAEALEKWACVPVAREAHFREDGTHVATEG